MGQEDDGGKTMKYIFCFALLFTSCARINKNLSTDPIYSGLIGRIYITQQDFTVFKDRDSNTIYIAASNDSNQFFDTKILGTLPKNSELKITEIRKEGNFEIDYICYYMMVVKSKETDWIGKKVLPMGMESYKEGDIFESQYLRIVR